MSRLLPVFFLIVIFVGFNPTLTAQLDSAFTFQGHLHQNGQQVSENCDFQFRLYDSPVGGSQIGAVKTCPDVMVNDGGFTVNLDFGAEVFDNSDRWLQIDVRCPAGSGSYTTLNPRQPITRAPYSIQTRGLFVDENEYVGAGTTLPLTPFHLAGTQAIMQTITSSNSAGTWLELNNTSTDGKRWGLLSTGAINGEGPGKLLLRSITLGKTVMTLEPGGCVGIGTNEPSVPLHVVRDTAGPTARFDADHNNGEAIYAYASSPNSGQAIGIVAETQSINGFGVFAQHLATAGNGAGIKAVSDANHGYAVQGFANATSGTNIGIYGWCNNPSSFDVYAGGPGMNYGAASSRRWKNNVRPIDNPLEKVTALRGVYFDWDRDHGGHHDVGMIAEEVGKILPEVVGYEENGIDASGMDYSKLTPLLVEAIKALRAEHDREMQLLRQENDALRHRVDKLAAILQHNKKKE